ncbi:Vacuolar protein sorting-associated protein 35 [Nowakowskiella sp. JEL0407]|nr:Vacuolar protein sorting-associated protein 35 [Nowakowskiella sp. JEL0407]
MEDQQKLLEEALAVVKQQAYHLRKSLDSHRLMDALKFASTMLSELRTSSLSPKIYYELYMAIFDELRHLTSYLYDAHMTHRHHLSDLYELVQYAGNIVPRLYLMITVGSVYMRVSKELLPSSTPAPATLTEEQKVISPIADQPMDSQIPDDTEQLFPEQAVAENREKHLARNYDEQDVPPIKELMKDLLEMSRGVQHPTRGLFLRYYLSAMTRDYLPDVDVEGPHGTINDSISFILQNFIEMNKLWVRLQHQGHSRDREKREVERKDLRLLVGSNLVRLSQLDGLDLDVYRNLVLPSILEEIVSCRDIIAQEYLMEVIIQVFHDDFHLRSLDMFLQGTAQLQRAVNVKQIVISLVDRFAGYAARARDDEAARRKDGEVDTKGKGKHISGIPDDVELFEVFWGQIAGLVNARPEFTIQDIIALLNSLLNLSLNCYPDRLDHVDQVLGFAYQKVVEAHQAKNPETFNTQTTSLQLQLLLNPIHAYGSNILTILRFPSCNSTAITGNYGQLLSLQPFANRKQVAQTFARTAIRNFGNGFRIDTLQGVEALFGVLCSVLVRDQPDGNVWGENAEGKPDNPVEWDDIVEEQELVAKLVHLIGAGDDVFEKDFELLVAVRKQFEQGGDTRIRFTVPALTFAGLKLARKYRAQIEKDESLSAKLVELYAFIKTTINALENILEFPDDFPFSSKGMNLGEGHVGPPEMAVRLYLAAVQSADECGFEEIAYEFFVGALTTFEDSVSTTSGQIAGLTLAITTLYNATVFSSENYAALASKCVVFGARLIKRTEQVKALSLATHLFWVDQIEPEVLEEEKSEVPDEEKEEGGEENGEGEKSGDAKVAEKKEEHVDERRFPPFRDSTKVLEMLQRAIKIADRVKERHIAVELFVDVLEQYIWFYERENEKVTSAYINSLITLIQTTISGLVETIQASTITTYSRANPFEVDSTVVRKSVEETSKHFKNVLTYIRGRQEEKGGIWRLVTF